MAKKGLTYTTNVYGSSRVARLVGSATFTPGATGAGPIRVTIGTITVISAKPGDFANVAPPSVLPAGCITVAEVTANDVVTIYVVNAGASQTPPTGIWRVVVDRDE